MRRVHIAVGALYAFGVIITFGHAAAHHVCATGPFENPCATQASTAAAVGASLWPLYWSWEAWS